MGAMDVKARALSQAAVASSYFLRAKFRLPSSLREARLGCETGEENMQMSDENHYHEQI